MSGEKDPTALAETLARGVAALQFQLPRDFQENALQFIQLLVKWNQAFNLTAVRDPAQMLPRHILDSLSVLPYLCGDEVLDVGTGAGLPGLVLALARPQTQFVLLDSNGKKCRFLHQAVAELGLQNVGVVHSRVERYRPGHGFGTVVSRAYSSIAAMLEQAGVFARTDGCVLAMKGVYPVAELDDLPAGYRIEQVVRLDVPGLQAERHLVVIRRTGHPGA